VEETSERAELAGRVAALDLGKAVLTACVRVPHGSKPGRRCQEVRDYRTTTASLLTLAGDLRGHGVTLVAMEAASDYWKPVFYLLEAEGFTCWLLNARHVKNVPGRPKTDRLDAVWLAKVVERGMCTPSLVQPRDIRRLRDLTRYRRTLIRERTAEKQRVEKLLEDAQIKLSSVASDIFGMSGRAMLEAMIAGERSPRALAQLAIGRMRAKLAVLEEALTGHFDDHHAFLCQMMLDRIDDLTRRAAELTARIEEQIAPYAAAADRLDEIPGVGRTGAQELIAEIGVDMTRFPDAAHLVSWAKFAPIDRSSAGKKKGASTGKGNPWLGATIGEIVSGAARTNTFLAERYQRIARRRGKRRGMGCRRRGMWCRPVLCADLEKRQTGYVLIRPNYRTAELGPVIERISHCQACACAPAAQMSSRPFMPLVDRDAASHARK
jgi:transposase